MNAINAKSLINVLKPIFSRHGIPVILQSDNGPPFNSVEFRQFLQEWGIQHTTSSPHLPRSNGLAESGVKIIKRILMKCDESGSDPHLALLQYRITPRSNLPSPSQLLMSRSLRTQMPVVLEHLRPKLENKQEYSEKKTHSKQRQKFYFDKKAKNLPDIHVGDLVWYKKNPQSKWIPAKVVNKCKEPRSFIVETEDGVTYRRNRQHLMKSTSTPLGLIPEIKKHEREIRPQERFKVITEELKEEQVDNERKIEVERADGSTGETGNSVKVTRSGRQIKPPSRYNDYY
ncbi:uncharacterized protein [Choristoneura fumiferana]|uniref:uncharacterized protein n=1 Tax=Choristoneura fumiferana TaxID=7141 RepID=UPI003D15DD8E